MEEGEASHEWRIAGLDHTQCRFEQWYEEDAGLSAFRRFPSFPAIRLPREQVHASAHRLMKLFGQDWKKSESVRAEILDGFHVLEAASSLLIRAITEMVDDKRRLETQQLNSDTSESTVELF